MKNNILQLKVKMILKRSKPNLKKIPVLKTNVKEILIEKSKYPRIK